MIKNSFAASCIKLKNKIRYKNILTEKRGAFPQQYEIAKNVFNKIFQEIKKRNFVLNYGDTVIINDEPHDNLPSITYKIRVYNSSYDDCEGFYNNDNGNHIITLYIGKDALGDLSSITISSITHELMHCYHQCFTNYNKNIDDNEQKLYDLLPFFIKKCRTEFASHLLYGYYLTYYDEINANVSAVENYIEAYLNGYVFKNKQDIINMTNEALNDYSKYDDYVFLSNYFKTQKPSLYDKNYLINCLINPCEINNFTSLYENGDVDKIIITFKKRIINRCEYAIEKMNKAKINFIEKVYNDVK